MAWWQRIPILRGSSVIGYECSLIEDKPPEESEPIFVAVHGTWAQKARWTERQSALMSSLAKAWPKAGILQFGWSGVNGVRHRIAAAEGLSGFINTLTCKHPHSQVIAVSHSHGGNVVAWASAMSGCRFDAAIYLNTPFIQTLREENSSTPGFYIMLWFVGFPLLFSTLFVLLGAIPLSSTWKDSLIPLLLALLITLTILGFMAGKLLSLIMGVRGQLVALSSSDRKIARELSVLVVGDEATTALGAVYFGQWVGRKLTWMLSALFFLLIVTSVVMPHLLPERLDGNFGFWLIAGVIAIPVLMFAVSMGAYGFVQGLISLDATVTVTPAPIGMVDYLTVSWAERDGLRHSLVYDSDLAITSIIGWLRETTLGS